MSIQAAAYMKYLLKFVFRFCSSLHFQEPPYGRLPPPPQPHPSLDELHRRRKEIMAQLEERKVISPPPFAPSPTLPPTFHQEEVSTSFLVSVIDLSYIFFQTIYYFVSHLDLQSVWNDFCSVY